MTTTVKVTAHCSAEKQVMFGITSVERVKTGVPLALDELTKLDDVVILKDGESSEKYVYGDRVACVLEVYVK